MHVWIQVFCVIYFYLLAIISQKKNNMLKNYHERFLSTRPMFFRTCIQKLCYQQSRSVFITFWCKKNNKEPTVFISYPDENVCARRLQGKWWWLKGFRQKQFLRALLSDFSLPSDGTAYRPWLRGKSCWRFESRATKQLHYANESKFLSPPCDARIFPVIYETNGLIWLLGASKRF